MCLTPVIVRPKVEIHLATRNSLLEKFTLRQTGLLQVPFLGSHLNDSSYIPIENRPRVNYKVNHKNILRF